MLRIALLALLLASASAPSVRADIGLPGGVPPQVEAVSARVLRGGEVSIELRGHYGGAGAVAFGVARPPRHGKLSHLRATGGNHATITYTSDDEHHETTDDFAYVVQAGGRVSSPAEVRIKIDDPPAKLQTIGGLDFGEIQAGQSALRELPITNSGGGILRGKVTVSSPWRVAWNDFEVEAGKTESVGLAFQPNEAKAFVGQVTLQDDHRNTITVPLRGIGSPALRVVPARVLFGAEPRRETVSLKNLTAARMKLTFDTGAHLLPIDDLDLAAGETTEVILELRPEVSGPVHEPLMIYGPRFETLVTMEIPPLSMASESAAATPVTSASVTPSAVAEATVRQSPPAPSVSDSRQAADGTAVADPVPTVRVTAHRLQDRSWELHWPSESPGPAFYRVEERSLSLDPAGRLETAWRPLPAIFSTGENPVTAKVRELAGHRAHVLRVISSNADGTTLWESAPVALNPLRPPSHASTLWLIGLALALAAFLFLRWRAR